MTILEWLEKITEAVTSHPQYENEIRALRDQVNKEITEYNFELGKRYQYKKYGRELKEYDATIAEYLKAKSVELSDLLIKDDRKAQHEVAKDEMLEVPEEIKAMKAARLRRKAKTTDEIFKAWGVELTDENREPYKTPENIRRETETTADRIQREYVKRAMKRREQQQKNKDNQHEP